MAAGLALLAALATGAAVLSSSSSGGGSAALPPADKATKGPLVISVTESGELEADKRTVIANDLQWPVIIRQVVPEGTLTRAGDTIIEFECKELDDAVIQQRLTVTTADNEYITAYENLALKKKESDALLYKVEQALIDAQELLRKYEEGEYPVAKAEAEGEIQMAKRDLTLAEGKLNFKLKVNQDPELNKPYSESEIESDRLGVDRLKLQLTQATDSYDILVKYTYPHQLRTLKITVGDATLGLDKVRQQTKTETRLAESLEQIKKITLGMQNDRLKELLGQEAKLVVKAARGGLVVYDTGDRRGPSTVNINVGEKINARQQIMNIPDMSTLQIRTKVYEAMIDQVQTGLPAIIRLDARPDQTLTGKISKVAVLPDSQNRWLAPDVKVYNIIVQIDDMPPDLKPGMTAQVELVLARLENVLSVPVAAVFSQQEQTYSWRVSGGGVECAPVRIGKSNDKRVEIVAGLAEGDRVLLAPPPGVKLPRLEAPADNPGAKRQPRATRTREAQTQPREAQSRPQTQPAEPGTQPRGPQTQPALDPGRG